MRILRADQHRRMRWKNGLGETIEIAVSPEGASLDAFDWRVSMAIVAADGPFSAFPGIDRTLCVLEGEGIALAIAGRPEVTLTPASRPFAFPADAPTKGHLVKGEIIDLNVMTRRGSFGHCVRRLAIEGAERLRCEAELTLLLSRSDGLVVQSGSGQARLGVDDAALLEGDANLSLTPAGSAIAFIVELSRCAATGSA
jgi:environmental stress-induced protein Ves